MKWTLTRKQYREDGIFGELALENGGVILQILEHAYVVDGKPIPKIAAGTYPCKLGTGAGEGTIPNPNGRGDINITGMHRLHDGVWFDAYEIMGVPEFQGKPVHGCLFHIANYNEDLDGCVGLGLACGNRSNGGRMLTSSKQAFEQFMKLGITELEVKDVP